MDAFCHTGGRRRILDAFCIESLQENLYLKVKKESILKWDEYWSIRNRRYGLVASSLLCVLEMK